MDKWKQEYNNEVKKNKIPMDLCNDTLRKIKLQTIKQDAKKYNIVGKRIAIIACFIIGILILIPTVSYAAYGVNILDLLANRNKEVKIGGGVSIGIPTNTTTYVYDGEELEIPYELTGSGAASVSGMLLLIDGISQPYQIKMNGNIMSDEEWMHVFDMTDTGKADFSFVFTPVKGKKGEKLSLNFVQVNDPEYQPEDENYVGYDFAGLSFSSNPVTIEFMEDSSNKSEYFAYEGPWTYDARKDKVLSGDTGAGYFVANQGVVDFVISIYGEKEGKYHTVLYINNKPVKIESKDYLECIVESGKSSSCKFSIDISNYDRINTVYAITTLVEDALGENILEYSRKTNSEVMINDLIPANYAEDNSVRDNILSNIKEGGSEIKELTKRLPDINWHVETKYLGDGIYLYLDNSLKLCKYDIFENEIIKASEPNVKTTDSMKLYDLASGYAIKYETFAADAVEIVFYDEDLVETKIVDASKLLERDEFTKSNSVSLSLDGRYLSYVDYNRGAGYEALYLYDLEKNEKKQIYRLYNEYPDSIKGSIYIYSLQFSKDNKQLYYVGSKYLTEEKQVNGIGIVDIDGENMKFYEANVNQDFLISNQYAMFYEGDVAKYNKGSKMLVTIDNRGDLGGYLLETKNESKLAFVSDEGNIFVTVEETELSYNPPYILRAYNGKTGELLMEQQTNFEDYDFSRIKQMIIMEDENAFVVYYSLETKVVAEENSYIEEGKAMIYNY